MTTSTRPRRFLPDFLSRYSEYPFVQILRLGCRLAELAHLWKQNQQILESQPLDCLVLSRKEECILSFAICIFLKIHPTRILFRTRKHSKQSTEKRSTKWWFRSLFPLAIFLSRMQTCNHDHKTLDSDVPHQSIALLLLMMRTAIGPSSGCNDLAPISRIKPDDVINQRFRKLYIEFYRSYHKFSRNDLLSTLKILISDLISLFPKPLH